MEKLDIGDIFEPDTEDTTAITTGTPISQSTVKRERTISGREISPNLKLAKVEEMTGYEKLRDGRSSIKLPKNEVKTEIKTEPGQVGHAQQPQQPTKSMVVSIPLPTSSTQAAVVMPQSTVVRLNEFFLSNARIILYKELICLVLNLVYIQWMNLRQAAGQETSGSARPLYWF